MKKKALRTAIISSVPPSTDSLWLHDNSISYFDKEWKTIFNNVYDINTKKNGGKPFENSGKIEDILKDAGLNKDKNLRFFKAYVEDSDGTKFTCFCFKSFECFPSEPNVYYVSQYYFFKDYLSYRKLKVDENDNVTVLKISGANSAGWITMFKGGKAQKN